MTKKKQTLAKKFLLSAKLQHDIMKGVVKKLKLQKKIKFTFHDPMTDHLDLENLAALFKGVDFVIVKVGSECSTDLLHYAKLHNIPTLHDIDTVLMCKNKVALDHALRMVLDAHPKELKNFHFPKSWTQSLLDVDKFKKWAEPLLPIVIKSHYQHDKYMRFNFLVREIEEVDIFCEKYKQFLTYDVYIQEFIECDGIDRKIYVIGDYVVGIRRENPIYIFMRDKPESIDVDTIEREQYDVSEDVKTLAKFLGKDLNLKIFGFDLIKPVDKDSYYLIDLNDFPGFRGLDGVEDIFIKYIESL